MSTSNDEYYAARADAERAKADACRNPDVAAVHRDLADLYEKKASAESDSFERDAAIS